MNYSMTMQEINSTKNLKHHILLKKKLHFDLYTKELSYTIYDLIDSTHSSTIPLLWLLLLLGDPRGIHLDRNKDAQI